MDLVSRSMNTTFLICKEQELAFIEPLNELKIFFKKEQFTTRNLYMLIIIYLSNGNRCSFFLLPFYFLLMKFSSRFNQNLSWFSKTTHFLFVTCLKSTNVIILHSLHSKERSLFVRRNFTHCHNNPKALENSHKNYSYYIFGNKKSPSSIVVNLSAEEEKNLNCL